MRSLPGLMPRPWRGHNAVIVATVQCDNTWNVTSKASLLIILSAIARSSAGLSTQLIYPYTWTLLFWRGPFAGLMIPRDISVRERRNTWDTTTLSTTISAATVVDKVVDANRPE